MSESVGKCEQVQASASGSMSSLWHHGCPPVPDEWQHTCTGASYEFFCIMRNKHLIELGYWEFLEDSE